MAADFKYKIIIIIQKEKKKKEGRIDESENLYRKVFVQIENSQDKKRNAEGVCHSNAENPQ